MKTKIVMLGTGTPNPDPERSGPSLAIIVGPNTYIVDAGVGLVRQAERARRIKGIEQLKASNLKKLFITHLHSDHTLGLADLIFTPWVLGREEELEVYGPRGTEDMVDNIMKAYSVDIDARINGLEPANTTGYRVKVNEFEDLGLIYKDDYIKVEALFADHMPLTAYAYKFITPDKTIIVSGDTSPASGIMNERDCDILIHEVFSSQGIKNRSMDWAIYHASVHTSSIDLGKLAGRVNPGKLVLYHQLFMLGEDKSKEAEIKREAEMIGEIAKNYKGEIISAKDLDIID